MDKVATGIHGLDEVIGGGFPRASLVLLSGSPGSGKTYFCSQFLHKGAELGEGGIYVSFAEDHDTFCTDSKGFGWDFRKLEGEGKFKFLDLATTREGGVAETLELILDQISSMKASRLVIDSYTALAAAFQEAIDTRIVMHTILGKMTRQLGCTTILTSESTGGSGSGQGEFVADAVIRLAKEEAEERFVRSLCIEKMRSTEIYRRDFAFTLHGGFRILPTPRMKIPEKNLPYEPISDTDTHLSTGCKDLDIVLKGGFPRKAVVLYENAGPIAYLGISYLLQWLNFASQGRGVIMLPREGVDSFQIRELMTRYVDEKIFRKYVRVLEKAGVGGKEDYIVEISGRPDEDLQTWLKVVEELKQVTDDKAVLWWVGIDRMEHLYDYDGMMRLVSDCQVVAQRNGDLIVRRAPTEGRACKTLAHMSSIHLKFANPHGSFMLMGVKPAFELHYFQLDYSKGYPKLNLIPVT